MSAVCCQVEVSATGRSLVQRSPTECGVFECDHEVLIMGRPWPTGGGRVLSRHGKKKKCMKKSVNHEDPQIRGASVKHTE